MKEDFLTIPDAPNYEINSELIVRNKKTGKILKGSVRKTKNFCYKVITLCGENGKSTNRALELLRTVAESAVENDHKQEIWVAVPSLNFRYEVDPDGICRNVRTRKILKPFNGTYKFSVNGQTVYCSIKDLLWETHGIIRKKEKVPIATTVIKGNSRLFFQSLTSAAQFIASQENYIAGWIYRFLNRREKNIFGWEITYHEPDDLSDVKAPIMRVTKW